MDRNRWFAVLLWVLVAACILGSTASLLSGRLHLVGNREYEMLERYAKLEAARETIIRDYYRETEDAALMDGAIRGMLDVLDDPYSFYYTPEEMKKHSNDLSGAYQGVGLLLHAGSGGEIEVLRVYRDSPAEHAGVLAGDEIIAVDNKSVSAADALAFEAAVALIGGEDGTQVRLKLLRAGKELELTIIRGSAHSSNAAWSMLPGGIGYISIFQFSGDAVQVFREALQALQSDGMHGLVIDLRSNPGGVMGDVVAIADEILPEGLIVYTEDRSGGREDYFAEGDYCSVPLAVLINGQSASASEVLAAAVQDRERGIVVGSQSFGKGIVQAVLEFTQDGSGMQYTFAEYFTPAGRSIHGSGVTPDIIVEGAAMPSLSGIPDSEEDVQLQTALNWLAEQQE